jgi:two-component system cell cycle response regulator
VAVPERILIADDDAGVRQSLAFVLQEQGYAVEVAANGAEVFAALERQTPQLLLLDAVMPDADGCELLVRLKGDPRWHDLPVLMLSAQGREDATERSLGLGAADHLRKPVRPRDLLARVQAQLRLRAVFEHQRQQLRAEEELSRAREEAESRRKLVDILHEVTGDLSADEIYHILARRVARALALSRCSVILASPGDTTGVVATAFDNPALRNVSIDLVRYPEIRSALELGTPVLVEDLQTSPLYDDIRKEWAANGTQVPIRSVIALPFTLDREQAGVFFLRRMLDEPPLTSDDVEFADAVIKAAVAAIQRAQIIESAKTENARLEVLAHTDSLTQLLNRRALTARLASELERARRYESVLSLLMIDLDHFKDVNDTYGHLFGDDVLRETALLLAQAIRSVDVVARYGGEEFVIVLPETPLSGAVAFAERVRVMIGQHSYAAPGGKAVTVTASIGVAVFPSEGVASVEELLARADSALYRAKADGRDLVRA